MTTSSLCLCENLRLVRVVGLGWGGTAQATEVMKLRVICNVRNPL
jgi:hypothetical protein